MPRANSGPRAVLPLIFFRFASVSVPVSKKFRFLSQAGSCSFTLSFGLSITGNSTLSACVDIGVSLTDVGGEVVVADADVGLLLVGVRVACWGGDVELELVWSTSLLSPSRLGDVFLWFFLLLLFLLPFLLGVYRIPEVALIS